MNPVLVYVDYLQVLDVEEDAFGVRFDYKPVHATLWVYC